MQTNTLLLCLCCISIACGTGTAEYSLNPEADAANDNTEAAASTDGCGGHGEAQCDQGSACNYGLQACIDGAAAGMCYFCCEDAAGTCGDQCQGDDPSAGYYDPDCEPTPPPPCGGHGQPHCAWDFPCNDGLQACSSGAGAGMCYHCCEDYAGTCGDQCQGDDPSAGYFDPDCEPECETAEEVCAGFDCGYTTNNCGEQIECGGGNYCGPSSECVKQPGEDLGVCTCATSTPPEQLCELRGVCGGGTVLDYCGEPVVCPGEVWGLGGYGGFAMCGDDFEWHNPRVPDGPDGCVQVGSRRYEAQCDVTTTQTGIGIRAEINCRWIRRCS